MAADIGKVKLDAPKGTGIVGGILYVSDITVVRNGSRGLLWLEPMVEVEAPSRCL